MPVNWDGWLLAQFPDDVELSHVPVAVWVGALQPVPCASDGRARVSRDRTRPNRARALYHIRRGAKKRTTFIGLLPRFHTAGGGNLKNVEER
jgi:hypothetical protein